MLIAGDDLRHDDALELASDLFNAFDFNPEHRQPLGQFLRRPLEIYILLEPIESDFHLELPQEPRIILIKQSDVVYSIANHRDTFDSETKRPAGPHLGVVADVFEHLRMHHAAAGDFQPLFAHLPGERAAEINLEAWLGIAEIVRTKSNPCLRAHQLLEHELDGAFQVTDGNVAVYVEALHLVESRVVRGVRVVAAIDAARHDDTHGRLLLFHHADLDGRSVRAQE